MSNNYNIILMIVDYLTKEKPYVLYTIDKNGTTTKVTS